MVASVLCGTANGMPVLVLYRALQGIGAGALMAVGFTTLGLIYPPEKLPQMHGVLNTVWAGAAILGPVLGGLLVAHASWRWIFFINLPTGILAGLLTAMALQKEGERRRHNLDLLGAITLIGWVVALLLAFGGERDPGGAWRPRTMLLLALALILLGVFISAERRAKEPILPLDLFGNRTITVCYLMGAVTGAALLGTTVFIPLFVQGSWGTTALQAGVTLIPIALAWAVSSYYGLKYGLKWFSESQLLAAGGILMAVSNGFLSQLGAGSVWWHVLASMILLGLGLGVSVSLIISTVQRAAPRKHMGAATAGTQLFRHLGGTVTVGILNGVMATQVAHKLRDLPLGEVGTVTARDLLRPDVLERIPSEFVPLVQEAFSQGVATIFSVNFFVIALNILLPFFLRSSVPWQNSRPGRAAD
jgi:MFS family permease